MPTIARMIFAFVFISAILALVEWLSFRLLKRRFSEQAGWYRIRNTWLLFVVLIWIAFVINGFMWPTWRSTHPRLLSIMSISFFVMFIPKLVMAGFELLELLRSGGFSLFNRMAGSARPISRESFLTQLGLGAAGLTFASFLYGVTWGKYAYRVEQIKVPLPNLPSAFNGLKIVQISDAHLGSFMDTPRPVLDALEEINSLAPDVILFTGDLVNTHADEAEPWIEAFSKLYAPLGKFSIMGNHDYADYGPFEESEREASRKRIKEIHKEMGFRLLLNEHHHFERKGERIALIGVENWGKGFRRSGDLNAAMRGSDAESLCSILMSHDPTHWEEEVMNGKAPVELTLSGHTHGMQFGIEIPWLGIKWSPSQWRYSRWAGLYKEASQFLHINRGFGVLGFHGRVGMPPEITVLEIEQA
jgi:predicted MPP superfamily phosphohydrolase